MTGITRTALFFVLLSLAGLGCGRSSSPSSNSVVYHNLIFKNTSKLNATVVLQAPATPSQPTFNWPATSRGHVVCALFTQPIAVRDNLITNQRHLVWLWHTGLGTGIEGLVQYGDGIPAMMGTLQPGAQPDPLQPGTYYWGVWALNDEGEPVISTEQYSHTVN